MVISIISAWRGLIDFFQYLTDEWNEKSSIKNCTAPAWLFTFNENVRYTFLPVKNITWFNVYAHVKSWIKLVYLSSHFGLFASIAASHTVWSMISSGAGSNLGGWQLISLLRFRTIEQTHKWAIAYPSQVIRIRRHVRFWLHLAVIHVKKILFLELYYHS